MKKLTCCLAYLLAAILHANQAAAEFTSPLAITGGTIITGSGERIEDGVILIDDGHFKAVGPNVDVPIYARTIDAKGMIIYPGFIDAHSQIGVSQRKRTADERALVEDEALDPQQGPFAATRLANRRGIDPERRITEEYDANGAALDKLRQIGFTVANAAPGDALLAGSSAYVSLDDLPRRRAIIFPDLTQHMSFDVGEPGDYPRTTFGRIAAMRQFFLDAQWLRDMRNYAAKHPDDIVDLPVDPALDAGIAILEGRRVIMEADNRDEIRRALDLAEEFKLNVTISGGREAYKIVDRLKAMDVPVIVNLAFSDEPEFGKKDAKKKDKEEKSYEPLKVREEKRRLWDEQVDNIIVLHKCGVPFACATHGLEKPSDLLKNLRKVVDRGLPAEVAVRALSTGAAELLNMHDRTGYIKRGQIANLTIMDKPIEDEKAKVRWVVTMGRPHEYNREDEKPKDDDKKPSSESTEEGESAEVKPPDAYPSQDIPPDTEDDEDDEEPSNDPPATMTDRTPPDAAPEHHALTSEEPNEAKQEASTENESRVDVIETGPEFDSEILSDRIPSIRTGGDMLIKGGTVLTITNGMLEDTDVLIREGKIKQIGRNIPTPPGVAVVVATGRYVMPGIIDCHSHMAMETWNESPLSISAEVRVADVLHERSVGVYYALAGGTTTAHVMHGSANTIGGQNQIVKFRYNRPLETWLFEGAPRSIKFATGENVTHMNSSRQRNRFPITRMGVEATMRRALISAQQYMNKWAGYLRNKMGPPPRRDLRLEALSDILKGDLRVHCHCYRADEILRVLQVAEDFGFRVAVLHHVLEGYRIAPELARHGCGASTFASSWAYKLEAYNAIPYNAAFLERAGVCTTVNSDSPDTIRYLNVEAAKSMRWGDLPADEAIKLVTINAARQLGIEDRVGSIEIGKDGDIAIFDEHPLNTFAKCIMTIIEGEVYYQDEREVASGDGANSAGSEERGTKADDRVAANVPVGRLRVQEAPPNQVVIPVSDNIVIKNAVVHTMAGHQPQQADVHIVDGDIFMIAPNMFVPGADVVDATGLHIYPGMIDAGCYLGLREIEEIQQSRDTRDIADYQSDLRTSNAIHPHSAHIAIARSAGFTAAVPTPSGGRISGQCCVVHLDGWSTPEMLIADDSALHMSIPILPPQIPAKDRKKRTEDHKKEMREIEDYLDRARRYAKTREAAKSYGIEYQPDLALEAMQPYLAGEKPVRIGANSYKAILDVIEFAEKQKLKLIIHGGREAWKVADMLAGKNIPVILAKPTSLPADEFEPWDSVYRCAAILDRAGVRFCFASDHDAEVYNLPFQIAMAVAHGLDPERAMFAATEGAAEILGVSDEIGSLKTGKSTDLIITTGHPCRADTDILAVLIKGRPTSLETKQTRDYQQFLSRPHPDLPPQKELKGPPSLTESQTD